MRESIHVAQQATVGDSSSPTSQDDEDDDDVQTVGGTSGRNDGHKPEWRSVTEPDEETTGELAVLKDARGSHSLHLFCPVVNFDEDYLQMKPGKCKTAGFKPATPLPAEGLI